MLLRDAQEETRSLYAALRNASLHNVDALASHMTEASALLVKIKRLDHDFWEKELTDHSKALGIVLPIG